MELSKRTPLFMQCSLHLPSVRLFFFAWSEVRDLGGMSDDELSLNLRAVGLLLVTQVDDNT